MMRASIQCANEIVLIFLLGIYSHIGWHLTWKLVLTNCAQRQSIPLPLAGLIPKYFTPFTPIQFDVDALFCSEPKRLTLNQLFCMLQPSLPRISIVFLAFNCIRYVWCGGSGVYTKSINLDIGCLVYNNSTRTPRSHPLFHNWKQSVNYHIYHIELDSLLLLQNHLHKLCWTTETGSRW